MRRLGLILVVTLGLIAALIWVAGREASLQWALARVTQATDGKMTFEGVRGSLFGTVDIARVRFASPEFEASASNASLRFSLLLLLRGDDLVIDSIAVESLALRRTPGDAPPQAPVDLILPLAVMVRALEVKQIAFHHGEFSLPLAALRAQFSSTGTQHMLVLEHVALAAGSLAGALRLEGVTPFALSGSADFTPVASSRLPATSLKLNGTLLNLQSNLAARAVWLSATGHAEVQPFASVPLRALAVEIERIDLRRSNESLPHAELKGSVRASVDADKRLTGEIALDNGTVGLLSADRLPLRHARARFSTDFTALRLDPLELHPARGAPLTGEATLTAERLIVQLSTRGFDLSAFHATFKPTQLAGHLALEIDGTTQQVAAQLADRRYRYELDLARTGTRVEIRKALLRADGGRLGAQGHVELTERFSFKGQVRLAQLDPAAFGDLPSARLNGSADVDGWLKPEWQARIALRLDNSRWRGQPLSAQIDTTLAEDRFSASRGELRLGRNDVHIRGALGAPSDRLEIEFKLGRLDEIAPQWHGAMHGRARLIGTWHFPSIEIEGRAEELKGPQQLKIAALQLQAAASRDPTAPLRIQVQARELGVGTISGDTVSLEVEGTLRQHELRFAAGGRRLALKTRLAGGLQDFERWQGRVEHLEIAQPHSVKLEAPMPLAISRGGVEIGAARLTSSGAHFDLSHFVLSAGTLRTQGRFSGLPLSLLGAQLSAGEVRSTLRFGGHWRIDAAQTLNGAIEMRRESGDLVFGGDSRLEARVNEARFNITADNNELQAQGNLIAGQGARVHARLATRVAKDGAAWIVPVSAPIALDAEANLPHLDWLGPFLHPGIVVQGALRASAQGRGTFGAPQFDGRIEGSELALSEPGSGVRLTRGTLKAHFTDERLILDSFQIYGTQGQLSATGHAVLRGDPQVQIAFQGRQLGLLDRSKWEINADTDGTLIADRRAAKLEARVKVNRALVGLPERSAPSLSGDVVIKGRAKPAPAAPASRIALDVAVDLGNAFRVRTIESASLLEQTLPTSRNLLDARLAGILRIYTDTKGAPLAKGNVRVVDGAYIFLGKRLEIKRGTFLFDGPLENPSLDILAMNEQLQVKVGAAVTGTAQNPRVRLVSDPEVPEQEKLSWLLFGRGGQSTDVTASARTPTGAGVTSFGFQLSEKLFVGFEHGATGASNAMTFYSKLTERLSVEARTGSQNGLRLFYTFELQRRSGLEPDRGRGSLIQP